MTNNSQRFKRILELVSFLGMFVVVLLLVLFVNRLVDFACASLGIYAPSLSCQFITDIAQSNGQCFMRYIQPKLEPHVDFSSWFSLVLDVLVILFVAAKVEQLKGYIQQIQGEYKDLDKLQKGYLRSADIVEKYDSENGAYHGKIYKSMVRDIDDIIGK